ncbi:hypothetical protein [Paraflavitalea speifideaquila]|uniref:hypothetical protein n=1 Tax=Paraflavitalea speifideaquila TaxID=3076558 RepID=UPI0028E6685B|nr:hypothetical protein [Paraflavitalea speifideiaquila]
MQAFFSGPDIELSASQNNVSLTFAALDYNRTGEINYWYKLKESDKWVNIEVSIN